MIFVSDDDVIAYYHAPKCGSRTMLGYLALIHSPLLYEKHPEYFDPVKGDSYGHLKSRVKMVSDHSFDPNQVPFTTNNFRIAIKRDPVDRFVSGYTNRIVHHKKFKDEVPTFSEFINNYNQFEVKYKDVIDWNFKPQVCFYGRDRNRFTHVFDINEFNSIKNLFELIYDREFPDLQLQQGGNKKKPKPNKTQIKWIKDKYREDYEAGWY